MITDNTAKWKAVKLTEFAGKSLPVGFMHFSLEKEVPAGELPAYGYLYNRILYADLWTYAQAHNLVISESEWQAIASANGGNCAYYSSGDGSTTFRVPSLKCWVKGASGVEEVGSYLEAGLPNIEGNIKGAVTEKLSPYADGSFYLNSNHMSGDKVGTSTGWQSYGVSFDASRSSSIYGNSDTVQPPSIVGMWLIVAFGVTHNIGNADVSNVMQAVEQVQTSVGTLEQGVGTAIDYIVESYRNGTEWYEVYKSGKVRQGGAYAQTTSGGSALQKQITLLKKMANRNYYANAFPYRNDVYDTYYAFYQTAVGRKTNTLEINFSAANTSQFIDGFVWIVEGQGA